MTKNFAIGFPDVNDDVQLSVVIPTKTGVFIFHPRVYSKYIIESMVIFNPVMFHGFDGKTEYVYQRCQTFFKHLN